MAGNVANTKIRAYKVTWGTTRAQVQTIQVYGDSAGSLNNTYFYLYSPTVKYHCWFNINSAGTDPAPGGSTAIVTLGATGVSASTLATALAVAIAAIGSAAIFGATASGSVVTVTNLATGYAHQLHDSKTSTKTGFGFALTTQGMTAADIGLVEGDIDPDFSPNFLAVKSHDQGTNEITQIQTGKKSKVVLNFMETSPAQLRKVLVQADVSMLPEGSGTTQVVGIGNGKQFQSVDPECAKLNLHPVHLADTDYSEDWTYWKAFANLKAMKFSGEKLQIIPVEFMMFPDPSQKKGFEFGVYGDGTQTIS